MEVQIIAFNSDYQLQLKIFPDVDSFGYTVSIDRKLIYY